MKTNENPSIMPEIKIVEPQMLRECAGAFLGSVVRLVSRLQVFPDGAQIELSPHYRGAAHMLDKALDNQPQLPFEEGGRWGSCGEY